MTSQKASKPPQSAREKSGLGERMDRLARAGEALLKVAHDIRNPLSPITGYAQFLLRRLEHVDGRERGLFEKALRTILAESDRISKQVDKLLDRTRAPEADVVPTCSVREVIEEAALFVGESRSVTALAIAMDASIGSVVADADSLRNVFINVLKNAAEAMATCGGGRIQIRGTEQDDKVIVEILDEGPGLDEAAQKKVFEPFFTTKEDGVGLGLASAKSAVEAFGGAIILLPRSDRVGTCARIVLVRASATG